MDVDNKKEIKSCIYNFIIYICTVKTLETDTAILPFNPSECISGKIMKCNRIIANVFRKHLMQFNITNSQLSIIFVVSKAKNSNQRKLSEMLCLEKSTVNRNIKRLLLQKTIIYNQSKELVLTKQGIELLNAIIPHWKIAMAEIKTKLNTEGEDALNLLTKQLTL